MKLIECYIENFGTISKQKFVFSNGLTCFFAENGAGKTTLSVFIKAMLYGLGESKKTSLFENERKRYLPWGGGVCAGSLTFSVGGKKYRVERSFAQKPSDDTYALYDLATGLPSKDFSAVLGEEIFEIDADGFERTVFLSERGLAVENDNKSISAKLSDLVGADGDIGVMDTAKKRLDSQRKFLNKKGGTGRISELKGEISSVELELSEIRSAEKKRGAAEAELVEYKKRLEELESAQKRLQAERTAALMLSAEERQREHVKEIKNLLDAEVKRKGELLEFFGGEVPTHEQLEQVRYKSIRAEELSKISEAGAESSEYAELRSYFDGRASETDIAALRSAYDSARISGCDGAHSKVASLFSKRIPQECEIEAHIDALNTPIKPQRSLIITSAILAAAAIICAVAGALLYPILYAVCAVMTSAAVVAGALAVIKKRARRTAALKHADKFILSVCDRKPTSVTRLNFLYEMKSRLEMWNEEHAKRAELEDTLDSILNRFDSTKKDRYELTSEILANWERLNFLSHSVKARSIERDNASKEKEQLLQECKEFFSKFNTKTENPFDEVHCALIEYQRLGESIIAKHRELLTFDKSTSAASEPAVRPLEVINADIDKATQEARKLMASIGIQSKSIMDEELLIERADELVMRRTELLEELAREEDRLSVILKTEKYLDAAKNSLTSKYLGKTRAGFEKYTRLISGNDTARYEMDTNFGVSVYEGGITRDSDAYSRGTRDLYSLAARLSLSDSLYDSEKPFIVLDDPFLTFDDKKTDAAKRLLCEIAKERQIIYFTCAESRRI